MENLFKVAGQFAGGGRQGQSQGQGQASGSSGLMHKITDAVTGQKHEGEGGNSRPYGGFPGVAGTGPGAAEAYEQRMPYYPPNPAGPYYHDQANARSGHMDENNPYGYNHQARPVADEHAGAAFSSHGQEFREEGHQHPYPGGNDEHRGQRPYPGRYDERGSGFGGPPLHQQQGYASSYGGHEGYGGSSGGGYQSGSYYGREGHGGGGGHQQNPYYGREEHGSSRHQPDPYRGREGHGGGGHQAGPYYEREGFDRPHGAEPRGHHY